MKKIFNHILNIIGLGLLIGLFAPIINGRIPEDYLSLEHWIIAFGGSSITYLCVMYFTEINPRSFYYCLDNLVLRSILSSVLVIVFIVGVVFICLIESTLIKIILLILLVLLFLFSCYVLLHRGICIYNNKIRVFKFKIYTFNNAKIDFIKQEQEGKYLCAIVSINGQIHKFKSSKLCLNRLNSIKY